MRPIRPDRARGFTLIEAVMVIVLTGIIAGIVSVIVATPMRGYSESVRRAHLTDVADVATRRMVRDLRLSLSNSVRITASGGDCFLEMIPAVSGGRYRRAVDTAGNGNFLNFAAADGSFDVIGASISVPAGAAHWVVIYNLNQAGNLANAYFGDNRRSFTNVAASAAGIGTVQTVTITPGASPFPFESPGARFALVEAPITNRWDSAGKTIERYSGYGWSAAQPVAFAVAPSVIVGGVTNGTCPFNYAGAVAGGTGLVSIWLQLGDGTDTITLLREAHVDNIP